MSLVALRCAGFNQIDLKTANRLGIKVVRVPAYSPYAVAEHTLALLLGLNRKTHRVYNRVKEGNFALEGLLGFDLHGLTVGVVGTGKIGDLGLDVYEEEGDLFIFRRFFELRHPRRCVQQTNHISKCVDYRSPSLLHERATQEHCRNDDPKYIQY